MNGSTLHPPTAKYRHDLPQLGDDLFIADGGLESACVCSSRVHTASCAAFELLTSAEGIDVLKNYYLPYVELALRNRTGIILDTATWRASAGWGEKFGYTPPEIWQFNLLSVGILLEIRNRHATDASPVVINGAIGPQVGGYSPSTKMDAIAAQAYHRHQVDAFAASAADMVTAVTMACADEAIGIARAARNAALPVAISFTVETDGRLPDGMTLGEAISRVDSETSQPPAYYMIDCAHPSHFGHVLDSGESWIDRIFGVRANASRRSHAEMGRTSGLDVDDPTEFGRLHAHLRHRLRNLSVVGGCCGADQRHISEVCKYLL